MSSPSQPKWTNTRASGSGQQPQRTTTRTAPPRTAPPSVKPATRVGGPGGGSGAGSQGGGSKGGGGGKATPASDTPQWKYWLRKIGFWSLAAGLITAIAGFIALSIVYSRLEVPTANDFAAAQASTVYYNDGTTVMGRMGVANREIVDITTLPDHVQHAVVAAEDRTFYTNPGIDFLGTGRALFKTVVLGKRQGGSSITQQYVERYYVGETTTDFRGKINEALLALKIDTQQDKIQVLGNYMNTIYYGRGAYGIQAAAREYYGIDAKDLTVSQAAMIAGIIPAPSAWDPRKNPEKAEQRWNYVLDGMVDGGWLTPEERAEITIFPATIEYRNEDTFAGPQGYLLRMALDEVAATAGVSPEEIESRGFSIVTTIDAPTQRAAEAAAATLPADAAPNLAVAIVTIDPKTGGITSLYGGEDYLEVQRNAVTQDRAQAGSTFKPFALVAALEAGVSLQSVFNGDNALTFPGFERPVQNFRSVNHGEVTLTEATANSVNTVYVALTQQVGADRVMDAAIRAGIPADTNGLDANPANVLGTASPHPLDIAHAYATFAAQGVERDPYIVQSVTSLDGEFAFTHPDSGVRAFDEAVMADATYAMTQVVQWGSGKPASVLERPIAGKTGTSSFNRSAWFVGYTPQIVGVVAMYQIGADGSEEEITPFGGFEQITGGTAPVEMWTAMMTDVFANMPIEEFPPRANVGSIQSPSPSPSPSVTPSPIVTPSVTPSPSLTPIPLPSPSLTLPEVPEVPVLPGSG